MIIYIILVLLILGCFMVYFHRKNKKVFKILRVLLVLVIIAVSTLFIFSPSSGLIDTGSYDISDVSMRGNKNIEVKVWRVNSEQIEIALTNHETTTFKYTDYFICRKYIDGQWENMSFSRDAAFAKHIYELEEKQSVERVIRWEDFFGERLKSGRYQLNWIAPLEFKIDGESGYSTDVEILPQESSLR